MTKQKKSRFSILQISIMVSVMLIVFSLGFFIGGEYNETFVYNDLVESVEYCESYNQSLRIYHDPIDQLIDVECWGEIPDIDGRLTVTIGE